MIAETADATIQRVTTHLSEQDTEVADGVRELYAVAFHRAKQILNHGPPQDQVALCKYLISSAAGLVGAETSTDTYEVRAVWDRLFAAQHVKPEEEAEELTPPKDVA